MRKQRLGTALCSDEGSIMPLAVGFTTIALVLVILGAVITDIYLAHRKLYALADSAALAAADSFEPDYGSDPAIIFTDVAVQREAESYLDRAQVSSRFRGLDVQGESPDDRSVEIVLSARYRPALVSPFVPRGIELTATARARGALREG
ncbi:pilus assembly protein TadG-related protein [Nocardia zapadnayensis]|uniref:pilus assembly protein TadG-related protein n=1 Tax=Brevibacterium sp. R8603A2 TaxID=2929779 RepID=UPI001FF72179|nr:pilus assembly protein TadG-related protein [Nocardia zapadnayensis]MCK1801502.1 pilus assembly protein TadG-related protein [Brevibacterium sp. R8603A2]MCX0277669.1 pilus assembly protein TadG-related protein [Nocardia zapadnayensis]